MELPCHVTFRPPLYPQRTQLVAPNAYDSSTLASSLPCAHVCLPLGLVRRFFRADNTHIQPLTASNLPSGPNLPPWGRCCRVWMGLVLLRHLVDHARDFRLFVCLLWHFFKPHILAVQAEQKKEQTSLDCKAAYHVIEITSYPLWTGYTHFQQLSSRR
jgi:hypothetical protein